MPTDLISILAQILPKAVASLDRSTEATNRAREAITENTKALGENTKALSENTEAIRSQTTAQVVLMVRGHSFAASGHIDSAWRALDAQDCQGAKEELDKAYHLDPSLTLYWLGCVVLAQLLRERSGKGRCKNVQLGYELPVLVETTAGYLRREHSSLNRGIWTARLLASVEVLELFEYVPELARDLVTCADAEFFPEHGREQVAMNGLRKLTEIAQAHDPGVTVSAQFFGKVDERLKENLRALANSAQPYDENLAKRTLQLLDERNSFASEMGHGQLEQTNVTLAIQTIAEMRSRISALIEEIRQGKQDLSDSRGSGCLGSFLGGMFGLFSALQNTSGDFLGGIFVCAGIGYVLGRGFAWVTRNKQSYPEGLSQKLKENEETLAKTLNALHSGGIQAEKLLEVTNRP